MSYYNTYDVVGASEVMSGHRGGVMVYPRTSGTLDGVKEWLDKESIQGVKNKYLVAGAAAAGLLYYGYKKRWF